MCSCCWNLPMPKLWGVLTPGCAWESHVPHIWSQLHVLCPGNFGSPETRGAQILGSCSMCVYTPTHICKTYRIGEHHRSLPFIGGDEKHLIGQEVIRPALSYCCLSPKLYLPITVQGRQNWRRPYVPSASLWGHYNDPSLCKFSCRGNSCRERDTDILQFHLVPLITPLIIIRRFGVWAKT